jgi:hypothetical protein
MNESAVKMDASNRSGRRRMSYMRNATWLLALRSVTRTFSITGFRYVDISDQ